VVLRGARKVVARCQGFQEVCHRRWKNSMTESVGAYLQLTNEATACPYLTGAFLCPETECS
jgi:hypothetical protein